MISPKKIAALVAVCGLGVAGAALYEHHAVAGTAQPLPMPNLAAGQVQEMVAPAATVVSTVHYQAELVLTCIASSCTGEFPKPGTKKRLNITRMTCILLASSGSAFGTGSIELLSKANDHLLAEFLPLDYASPSSEHYTLNRAVDLQVSANQHIRVALFLPSGTPKNALCSASGTLDSLG